MSLPRYEPMLATRWPEPFSHPEWSFEVKWDGVRALVFWDGTATLRSRRGLDVTAVYPELGTLVLERPAVLDGEIISPDGDGRPSFEQLQGRMNLSDPGRIAEMARSIPVHFMAFDLLYEGGDLTVLPLEARLERLADMRLPDYIVRPDRTVGDGEALFEAVRQQGLEGVVAKRLGSTYRSGSRSADWRKIAAVLRSRAVVGGFTPGEGGRAGTFGALLLGLYQRGALRWIGSVGTGFTDQTLEATRRALDQIRTAESPFAQNADLPARANWVTPSLVAEVEFKAWTKAGRLRAPSFKGFAVIPPEEVTWNAEGPDAP